MEERRKHKHGHLADVIVRMRLGSLQSKSMRPAHNYKEQSPLRSVGEDYGKS